MTNDEDSDDDIPISQLRRKKSNGKSRVASALSVPSMEERSTAKSKILKRADDDSDEYDDDEQDDEERKGAKITNDSDDDDEDDDDVPISELVKKRQAKVENELHSPDEDDDSDVPISELVKKKPAIKGANKRTMTEKKSKTVRKTQQNVDKSSPKKRQPIQEILQPAKKKKASGGNHEAVFYETQRGKLVQALLRRWWYAIEWPSKETREIKPDENFEELPAFPGVHICTSGPRLGEIVDHRNHSKSPCFTNLYAMPTGKLKSLVATAYNNQIKQLTDREPDSPLLTGLKKEMIEAARIDADKADTQARKAMIAYENNTKAKR